MKEIMQAMKKRISMQKVTATLITFTVWHARKLTTRLAVRHRALPRSCCLRNAVERDNAMLQVADTQCRRRLWLCHNSKADFSKFAGNLDQMMPPDDATR